ncbi:hypothetical protein K0M31_004306 [Melipona bicolor]|uniref:Uncharacterized protein n=1 Tax=Melipona bicolor TaxID=60889 RepID=A0AA40KND7_9HYME|nr:hypothetical protein K0M31_004306 [Melipona bicolor]
MELRTLHLLCYLCVACTLVQSRWSNRDTQSDSVSEESTGLFNANNLRDKRALGLILSGLAQVFGYAVDPVQIASLPNPNSEAGVTNGTRTNSTESNNGSTTSAAGQRETIRFTGVVNLGNGTDVLTQLQRYENIFHGGSSSSNGSSSSPPRSDPKTQAPDQPQPIFVKRLPSFMTESPLPIMPQAPLPEIPSQFINLSYPEPYVAPIVVRGDQDTAPRKQNTTVKDQPPTAGRSLPTTSAPSVQDPGWKQEYEDRLAELERKQEEHARRLALTEQERYRDDRKNGNHGGSKEQINHGGQDPGCKGDQGESGQEKQSGEEDQSRDRYESGEKIRTSDKESEEDSYGNYKNDDIYKGDTPQTGENYTSILQYSSEPLPLSEDDEQRRPEDLRNSYGEPLFNRELLGFAHFFGKFKQPFSDIYSSSAPPESKEEASEEKGEDESDEKDIPARNKYEEYTLEGDASNGREGEKKSEESPMKIFNNESNDESPSSTDELDFSKFMPLIVPVRYLTAPEESRKTQLKSRAEVSKKVSPKESKRPKKENVKPVVGLSERRTPKKLHEGEEKETHIWPPPFDFVFDGTIHTNIVSENSNTNDNIKVSNDRGNNRESDSSLQKERNRVTLHDSTRKPYDYPENIYYQNFKKESGYGTVPGKQIVENGTTSGEETEDDHYTMKPDQDDDDRKEVPDFLERYKYNSSDNYGIAKRPNVGTENLPNLRDSSSLRSKNLESSKRSIERNEQSLESEQQLNVKNRVMQDAPASQRKFQSTMFFDPMQSYDLFDFDASVYDLNYGRRNERLSGIPEGGKKIGNEERVSLAIPQQNVYRYDESLTKFASEPESKAVKVENYANGATVMRMMEQERDNPSGPISYVDYSRIL